MADIIIKIIMVLLVITFVWWQFRVWSLDFRKQRWTGRFPAPVRVLIPVAIGIVISLTSLIYAGISHIFDSANAIDIKDLIIDEAKIAVATGLFVIKSWLGPLTIGTAFCVFVYFLTEHDTLHWISIQEMLLELVSSVAPKPMYVTWLGGIAIFSFIGVLMDSN